MKYLRFVGLMAILALQYPQIISKAASTNPSINRTNRVWINHSPLKDAFNAIEHKVYLPLIFGLGLIIPEGMVYVPAGYFQRGCDAAHNAGFTCPPEEIPLRQIYLYHFFIDKYEVTNWMYSQCVAAGACLPPASTSSLNRTFYYGTTTYAAYPVIHVDWTSAKSYCIWAGKRLPSEAEWEKAARGSNDTRTFPWGETTPNCTLANSWEANPCTGDTSLVGQHVAGASPYGAFDMAGNVWEWVVDWYADNYYNLAPEFNPPGPASGTSRVLRGGCFLNSKFNLRVTERSGGPLGYSDGDIGFRCSKTP